MTPPVTAVPRSREELTWHPVWDEAPDQGLLAVARSPASEDQD
jgi:hypothetical protein